MITYNANLFSDMTGDNIFGDDSSDSAKSMDAVFAPAIASNIPWVAILGNHDQEGSLSREGVMKYIVGMKNTLAKLNPPEVHIIDGFGNYNLEVGGVQEIIHKRTSASERICSCSASVNSGFFTTLVGAGDVKAVFVGHDHLNDFCGKLMDIQLCYAGGFGYHAYGKAECISLELMASSCGARAFTGSNIGSPFEVRRSSDDSKGSGSHTFTTAQYEQLLQLIQHSSLNQSSSASSNQVHSSNSIGHSPVGKLNTSLISSISCQNTALGSWIIDSGASHHVCGTLKWFHSYNEIHPIHVKLPIGHYGIAKHAGNIKFSSDLILHNVLYVPNFTLNLLSVSKLCFALDCTISFNGSHCLIQEKFTKRTTGYGDKVEDFYYLVISNKLVCNTRTNSFVTVPHSALWHFRLGHPYLTRMQSFHSQFPFITVDSKAVCDVCHFAKHKKLPFSNSFNNAVKPFELFHFDIWGPIAVKSVHHRSYFLTAVDDHCRYTWLTLMKHKSEARQHVIDFITLISFQFNANIKTIRTDNGAEFNIPSFYASQDITHDSTINDNFQPLHEATPSITDPHLSSQHHNPSPNSPINLTADDDFEPESIASASPNINNEALTRPVRQKHAPSCLNDCVCNTSSNHAEIGTQSTRDHRVWKQPIKDNIPTGKLSK
ncbi:putative inactive purple acid phosphatase [Trifolium repens]|nr:putative inactive purple acid phosphatase [Trifolium repens]